MDESKNTPVFHERLKAWFAELGYEIPARCIEASITWNAMKPVRVRLVVDVLPDKLPVNAPPLDGMIVEVVAEVKNDGDKHD